MPSSNSIREAITSGTFCYMIEMVASKNTREAQLFQTASDLAQISELAGAGITSYAGGSDGHDPIRVGTGVRARGLTPNIHLTCVNKDRLMIRDNLQDLAALGIDNIFAISGDYPKAPGAPTPIFDVDSVQLVEMINEVREHAGIPFFISVAISPFKYVEADSMYQYLKLEKKIAAGANFAISQLGYDIGKLREMKRYLDERGIKFPILGNVYALPPKAAERMSKGDPPGCWVAPELVAKIQEEAKAPDKGIAARLERAAQMVAIMRGLGFAGAYIGGESKADRVQWIIKRSVELAPQWEELAEKLNYGDKNGFYLYSSTPAPAKSRGFGPAVIDTMGSLFPVKKEPLRSLVTGVLRAIDHSPTAARALERFEFAIKAPAFGCQACGNCVLPDMEYVCPQTCPKGMRNGPCGGTFKGQCEVIPEQPCIWVSVYDRAKAAGRIDELKKFVPAPNRALKGTSSWINFFLDRDSRPDHPQPAIVLDHFGEHADASQIAAELPVVTKAVEEKAVVMSKTNGQG